MIGRSRTDHLASKGSSTEKPRRRRFEICARCVDDKVQKRMKRSLRAMTDTDRIERGSYDDIGGLDDALDEWDEYSSDDGAEDEYEDFLDWLNDRA